MSGPARIPRVIMESSPAMSVPTSSGTMSAVKAFQPPLKAMPTSSRGLANAGVVVVTVMVGSFPVGLLT